MGPSAGDRTVCTHWVNLVRKMGRCGVSQAQPRPLSEHRVREVPGEPGIANHSHPDTGVSVALSIRSVLSQPGDKLLLQASISLNRVT